MELIHPHSLKYLSEHLHSMVKGRLWLKILIGMVLGLAAGLLMGPSVGIVDPRMAYLIGEWLSLPGYVFLGLLQMIVVPLVFASIIRGIAAGEDVEQLRRVGLRVVLYFLVTTAIAIAIGLGLALFIKPGLFISSETIQGTIGAGTVAGAQSDLTSPTLGNLPGMLSNLIPINPLGAMVSGQMLQVVMFSVIIGVALVSMTPFQSKPMLELLGSLQEVCMTVVRWTMLLAPLAVFGLLTKFTLSLGIDALLGMTVYVGTVILGLLIMLLLYLLIVLVVAGKRPISFLRSVRDVMLLAFSTSSTAAVMPMSIKTVEDKLNVRPSISQFVIPLGATVNMNGTALYQSVATVFLAQVFGIDLGFWELLLIMVTVVGASIGTPSTPGIGIVILALVLNSVGIPTTGIALIIGVDRILDMCRTSVNLTGDLVACTVMDRWVGSKKSMEQEFVEAAEREWKRKKTGEDVLINNNGSTNPEKESDIGSENESESETGSEQVDGSGTGSEPVQESKSISEGESELDRERSSGMIKD